MILENLDITKLTIKSIINDNVIIYDNSSIYQGQILNKLPHGNGKYITKDKSKIEGSFKNGHLHGECDILCYDNDIYSHITGTWDNNIFCGKNQKIIYNSATYYIGETYGYIKNGYGSMHYSGSKYVEYIECNWINNIPNNKIKIKMHDKELFETSLYNIRDQFLIVELEYKVLEKDNVLIEIDIHPEIWVNNLKLDEGIYTGYSVNNVPHIYGTLVSDTLYYTIFYTGSWKRGLPHGKIYSNYFIKNIKKAKDINLYKSEGYYQYGKKYGSFGFRDIFSSPDIEECVIDFDNDNKTEKGNDSIIYKNGNEYVGYINDKFLKNGDGTLLFPGGYISGKWIHGNLSKDHPATFKSPDGLIQGKFIVKNLEKNMKIIPIDKCTITSDSYISSGNYVNGKQDGIHIIECKITNTISKCLFKMDKMIKKISEEHIISDDLKLIKKDNKNIYLGKNYRYRGNMVNNQKHGIGILEYDTCIGPINIEGEWDTDSLVWSTITTDIFYFEGFVIDYYKLILMGKHIYKNGSEYNGKTIKLKRKGFGILKQFNFIDLKTVWKNDLPNGIAIYTHCITGESSSEIWKNGIRVNN